MSLYETSRSHSITGQELLLRRKEEGVLQTPEVGPEGPHCRPVCHRVFQCCRTPTVRVACLQPRLAAHLPLALVSTETWLLWVQWCTEVC